MAASLIAMDDVREVDGGGDGDGDAIEDMEGGKEISLDVTLVEVKLEPECKEIGTNTNIIARGRYFYRTPSLGNRGNKGTRIIQMNLIRHFKG